MSPKLILRTRGRWPRLVAPCIPRFYVWLNLEHPHTVVDDDQIVEQGYRLTTIEVGSRWLGNVVIGYFAWRPDREVEGVLRRHQAHKAAAAADQ